VTVATARAAHHEDLPRAYGISADHEVTWPVSGASPARGAGQPPLIRVEVTQVEADGTMWRRMIDTAVQGDAGRWQQLIARALAVPAPYRPVPGNPIYHLRLGDREVLIADHDLCGPLLDLVTAVLAFGEAM
jgi:hypothetical protein